MLARTGPGEYPLSHTQYALRIACALMRSGTPKQNTRPRDAWDGCPQSPAHERRRPRRNARGIAGEGRAGIKKRCTHSAICAINAKAPRLRGLRRNRKVKRPKPEVV